MQDRESFADLESDIHVVLDHQHGDVPAQASDQSDDVIGLGGRQSGGRLVEQQQTRPVGKCHGDLELALLAVGEIAHPGGPFADEPPLGEQALDAPHGLLDGTGCPQQCIPRRRERLDREMDILRDGEAREQRRDLESPGKAGMGAAERREVRDILTEQHDAPARRAQLAADEIKQRRFAGSVRAEHGTALARGKLQRHTIHGMDAAEIHHHVLDAGATSSRGLRAGAAMPRAAHRPCPWARPAPRTRRAGRGSASIAPCRRSRSCSKE